ITLAEMNSGSVTNTATASAKFGTTTVTDTAFATVTADQKPAIKLTKPASPTTYVHAGQTITYTYVIENTGNVTVHGTAGDGSFEDRNNDANGNSPPTTTSLDPTDTVTCTGTHTITLAEMNSGPVTNTATASAKFRTTHAHSHPP